MSDQPIKHPWPLRRLLPCVILFLLTTVSVHAHHLPPGMEDVDEFENAAALMAGLRHPLLGVDHWLFAVAVGAIAAFFMKQRRVCLWVLAGAMSIGGAMGVGGLVISGAAWSGVFALTACALLFVLRQRVPLAPRLGLIATTALLQGNAHGLEWPLPGAGAAYLLGMVMATLAFALAGNAVVVLARRTVSVRRYAH